MQEETKKANGLENKPVEPKKEEPKKEEPKKRQIILETDGSSIRLVKAEVAGTIELIAILGAMIEVLTSKKNS